MPATSVPVLVAFGQIGHPRSYTRLLRRGSLHWQFSDSRHVRVHCTAAGARYGNHLRPISVQCQASATPRPAAYPAGKRQAKVKLPAFVISVTADEVLGTSGSAEQVAAAVGQGATAVLLSEGTASGGAELYSAAVQLKEQIRGRAVLLIADRSDIADAVEADGVVLSPKGLPLVVVRRTLQNTAALIGRAANSPSEAADAAAEGASLVILQGPNASSPSPEDASSARSQQRSSGKIPIISVLDGSANMGSLIAASADGAAIRLSSMQAVASGLGASGSASLTEQAALIAQKLSGASLQQGSSQEASSPSSQAAEKTVEVSSNGTTQQNGRGLKQSQSLKQQLASLQNALLEDERQLLTDAAALLKEVTPQMEELGLLDDAIKQLDELFLLVVVGEFNSGKSTIINALLGSKFLADGILPTTNEISILKYSTSGQQEMVQTADGSFVQYIPAPLLEQVNIVDTPGTNVIVDRQQRLTEEFVPRADLVLFCLSADRPFTDSEVKFLRYIREWGKKVVFIVNKVDNLSSEAEEQEVAHFVSENARRMLGVQSTQVLPVSARKALKAKTASGQSNGVFAGLWGGGKKSSDTALSSDPDYQASRFGNLEKFIFDFLVGTASGGEGARLKLQTPLFVSDALLEAARNLLEGDLAVAQQEAKAARAVKSQLESFRRDMEKDGEAQRAECRRLVNGAVKRASALIDETLQLSNASALSAYLLGGSDSRKLPIARSFQNDVVGDSAEQLQRLAGDHGNWLQSNCQRQVSAYRSFAEERVQQLSEAFKISPDAPTSQSRQSQQAPEGPSDAAARKAWREARTVLDTPPDELPSASHSTQSEKDGQSSSPSSLYSPSTSAITAEAEQRRQAVALSDPSASSSETAAAAVARFEPRAAAALLEEEIREAFVGTVGSAVGAGLFGVVLTWVLPTTLEDLLAASLAGLAGYISLLNLPLKRADAKAKLQRTADGFLQDIEAKLERELVGGLDACRAEVMDFMRPVEALTQAQVDKLQHALARLERLQDRLEELKQRAANVE